MKKIILIGGAPATGKSTIAKRISKEYSISWISADFIRNWMKLVSSPDMFPDLFGFSDTAEEHYAKHSIAETIVMEEKRDRDVWKGVQGFIEKNKDWGSYVIEGITIHPSFIQNLQQGGYDIVPLFIIENNKQRMHDILYSRGLWGDSDEVKEIEKDYLVETNKYYKNEAIKYDLPYFEIADNRDATIAEIMTYLNDKLKK